MKKRSRRYKEKTIKVIFALSGNQCAYPGCPNLVIVPPTEKSDYLVLNQICHIYAFSVDGPRGKAGLTEEEINAPENLILFCPTHHTIIDGQHETFPADLLKGWKKAHEEEIQKKLSLNLNNIQPDVISHPYFPIKLIDQKIAEDTEKIRKCRFYNEFDSVNYSLILANKLLDGELSGGSSEARCKSLAWCARFISHKEIEKAEECLKVAKSIGNIPEIKIAEAFICSWKNDKVKALSILYDIGLPISRSAALRVVAHHEGPQAAIDWIQTTSLNFKDFDSDGKYFFQTLLFTLHRWDSAIENIDLFNSDDIKETPILKHIIAISNLLKVVPSELCSSVVNQIPFNASGFPLSSNESGISTRSLAYHQFIAASIIESKLNLPKAAMIDNDYALWLELMDPKEHEHGRKKLEDMLRDLKSSLRLVHLGFQFGIKLDIDMVKNEIERIIELNGELTYEAAVARFALAFTYDNPEAIASYISKYIFELSKYFDKRTIQCLQIEMLLKAGLIEKANDSFQNVLTEGLSNEDEDRLRKIFAEANEHNEIIIKKNQFNESNSINDLIVLVDVLVAKSEWEAVCIYSKELYDRTNSLKDAKVLANAFIKTNKFNELVDFFKTNSILLDQSGYLRMLYCWSLYYEGLFLETQIEIKNLNYNLDNADYRSLLINLNISMGNWESLNLIVVNEYQNREKRNAQELVSAAQLALQISSPHAKDMLFTSAESGKEDAKILTAAYFLATNAGWENDSRVAQWIERAAALSGEDGPIYQVSIKDILKLKPNWDRKETEVIKSLNSGDIPMFLAAESLNRSLVHMMLFTAFSNYSETDPRRKNAIYAFCGNHQIQDLKKYKVVAMDATVILTLSYLNLLEVTINYFDNIYIPHSTLQWLFEEKNKVAFHQPSRIEDARKVQHLLAKGILEKVKLDTVPESKLSAQVGEELALLITEAFQDSSSQCFVVRSYPVYRISSLLEEEADLTQYETKLSSCQAIIDKLREKGQITLEELKKAKSYLQLHEKPWPNQPEIVDGSVLYLDDLSISYFIHLGVLEKLKTAGFKIIVSPREVSTANELITYEGVSEKISSVIEAIRFTINEGIKSKKVKVGKRRKTIDPEDEERPTPLHPTVEVISLASYCEAIIIDDRFFNQHSYADDGFTKVPVFTTIELLDMLFAKGIILEMDLLEYRTMLQKAGYLFVPINEEELFQQVNNSSVNGDKIIETTELKAIRENILQVRMMTCLQLPKESFWLDSQIKAFIHVIDRIWKSRTDYSMIKIRANWLLNQIDVRGWAHKYIKERGDYIVKTGRGAFILLLLKPPINYPIEVRNEYTKWIENDILAPIKEQDNDLYLWIVEWYRQEFIKIVNQIIKKMKRIPQKLTKKAAAAKVALQLMPLLIQSSLLDNDDFVEEYNIKTDVVISFPDYGITFQRSILYNSVKEFLAGNKVERIIDNAQQKWELIDCCNNNDFPIVEIKRNKKHILLPRLLWLSSDKVMRSSYFNKISSEYNLIGTLYEKWYNILNERPLEDDEVDELQKELLYTPIEQIKIIRSKIEMGSISIASIVPNSRSYYEKLVGIYDGSSTIQDYVSSVGKAFFQQLFSWNHYNGILYSLLLSSHPSFVNEISLNILSDEELIRIYNYIEKYGDIISQLGLIEIGFNIISSRPGIEEILLHLIEKIKDDDAEKLGSDFNLLSSLFTLIDGELSQKRIFSAEPPFYRRLASLSHASLVFRELKNSNIDIGSFCKWAFNGRAEQFYLQTFADMRIEPRWNPSYSTSTQMKEYFFGRIIMASKVNEKNVKNEKLLSLVSEILLDERYITIGLFYPGPLEGALESSIAVSTELIKIIETQLNNQIVSPHSFYALTNYTHMFNIDKNLAEHIANMIKKCNYQFAEIESRAELIAILYGIASAAATSRSCLLANELRVLVRVYKRGPQYALSIDEVINICLEAASSRSCLDDWRDFVGDWLTELAFGDLKEDEANTLYSFMQCLCTIVPELWVTCGRANAALMAYNGRA